MGFKISSTLASQLKFATKCENSITQIIDKARMKSLEDNTISTERHLYKLHYELHGYRAFKLNQTTQEQYKPSKDRKNQKILEE